MGPASSRAYIFFTIPSLIVASSPAIPLAEHSATPMLSQFQCCIRMTML